MRTRLFIPAAATLLFALAACTRDEAAEGTLPAGEYPVIIQANGLDVTATPVSRATVDGDWQGVQTVALKMGDAVKEYDVTASDADGYKSATLSCENDPHYWTSRDPITVSAWWPLDKADITRMPAVKVAADQSKLADFQNSDFISAENQTVQFDNPTLEFSHRTARITVLLKPGDGIPSVTRADVYVTGLGTDNSNPATIRTYAPDGDTYEALTAPQTVKANTPFIQVDLGGGTYYFRPHSDVVLAAGSRYTYTVSVTAKGLELAGCTIGGWTDGGGESGTAEDLGYFIQDDGSYTVYNANGLLAWNEAAQSDYTLNCTLTENINLTGKEWTPVGNSFQTYNGTFDGQGYSITGLNASSLFGGIGESATVKNLQLVDVKLNESSGATAGIVVNNYGTIMACSMTGEISAFSFTSGIANFNLGTIVACWFSGTLKENEGYGIVAFNYGTITACFWDGNTTNGYRSNEGGTVEATKVDDSTVTWQTAVDGMNEALTDNGYQWKLGTDGLPVLQKKQ